MIKGGGGKKIEEGSGSGSCSLLPLPAKGKVANWEGGGLGEIIEKGWHTLKPMRGMMHTTMIMNNELVFDNPTVHLFFAVRRGFIGKKTETKEEYLESVLIHVQKSLMIQHLVILLRKYYLKIQGKFGCM